MNLYKYYRTLLRVALGTILLSVMFVGCESQTVDLSPVDRFTDETAFDTQERCELAIVGVYHAAQSGPYSVSATGERRGYPFGSAAIQQSEMRGQDMALSAAFYNVTFSSAYNAAQPNNGNMWFSSFACINRANVVIEGITKAKEKGVITEDVANAYLGECYFLRALCYHNLMVHFALPVGVAGNNDYGLPLYEIPTNTPSRIEENLKVGRSTVNETYNFILKDLTTAESYLSSKHAVNSITRATKGAAIALKTRVYLHKKEWSNVMAEAEKLIGQTAAPYSSPIGGYTLTASPETPFVSYANNTESIFSIECSQDNAPSINGALASMMSAREGGRAIITLSPIIYNTSYWKENDKRRALLFYRTSDMVWYCDKYKRPQERDEYAPIIRYAEVLMNYAEAAFRSGDQSKAVAFLNAVRDRSKAASDPSYALADFSTDKELLDAILWERRIEFQGEGMRWYDIHRLVIDELSPSGGIPLKMDYAKFNKQADAFVIGGAINPEYAHRTGFIPYTDRRFLWPIPNEDVLRNATLAKQQNFDW